MDGISNLPDEIINQTRSFLSAKEAAFTTVLSKRWRNTFTIIPDLVFDNLVDNGSSIKDLMDGVLALPVSSRALSASCAETWKYCLLPWEVFNCKTVAELRVRRCLAIHILPRNAFLPALKKLVLESIKFYDFGGRCSLKTLLDACPVLEDLTMSFVDWKDWRWSRIVSSPSLRKLKIHSVIRGGYDDFESISFDTPSLTYLYYNGYAPKKYPIVNLNSLVEAELKLCAVQTLYPAENYLWEERHPYRYDPMNLIMGLKSVEILQLHTVHSLKMFYVFRDVIPVFENLYRLSVKFTKHCWYPMPILIKNSPKLKILVIEGYLHSREDGSVCECVSEYSFLWSCPLNVLKITQYWDVVGEVVQLKHFLEKLSCLELVEVHASTFELYDRKMQLMADLEMLPRASSKCKFQINEFDVFSLLG